MKLSGSWRTSLFGKGGIVAIIVGVVSKLLDGDPATVVDWGIVIPALITSIALLFTRDDNVSSEEAKAAKA